MNPGLAETILRLKQHGRRITLFSFARQSPEVIPGVTIYHIPFTA
jgi:hypothetical protein